MSCVNEPKVHRGHRIFMCFEVEDRFDLVERLHGDVGPQDVLEPQFPVHNVSPSVDG